MKRETILKIFLVLTMISILFTMSVNVYAEPANLDDFFEDQGGLEDIGGSTTPETPTTTPEPEQTPTTPSTPSTETTTGTTQESTYSDAGIAEDTLMVVTIAGLVIAAIFAYRKVNEYQNI